jgi:hypothetical protein
MSNTADRVRLGEISKMPLLSGLCPFGDKAVNPLVAFYDIHGKKSEVLFFCSHPDTTRDQTRRD